MAKQRRGSAGEESPAVNWNEADSLISLFREATDLRALYGGACRLEQILVRVCGALTMFAHEINPEAETYSRTTLPEPLSEGAATIGPRRPGAGGTLGLHLQPSDPSGIVSVTSTRTPDGSWLNATARGVPFYVKIESADRDRLEALRRALFDDAAAVAAAGRDVAQANWQRTYESLDPTQQRAASLERARQLMGTMPALGPIDESALPPELRQASRRIQGQLADMVHQARKLIDQTPLDEATRRAIEESVKAENEARNE